MNLSPPLFPGVGDFEGGLERGDFVGVFEGVLDLDDPPLLGVFDDCPELQLREAFILLREALKLILTLEFDESTHFFCQRGMGPRVMGSSIRTTLLNSFMKL